MLGNHMPHVHRGNSTQTLDNERQLPDASRVHAVIPNENSDQQCARRFVGVPRWWCTAL